MKKYLLRGMEKFPMFFYVGLILLSLVLFEVFLWMQDYPNGSIIHMVGSLGWRLNQLPYLGLIFLLGELIFFKIGILQLLGVHKTPMRNFLIKLLKGAE